MPGRFSTITCCFHISRKLVGDDAGLAVGVAAGGERHDDAHRLDGNCCAAAGCASGRQHGRCSIRCRTFMTAPPDFLDQQVAHAGLVAAGHARISATRYFGAMPAAAITLVKRSVSLPDDRVEFRRRGRRRDVADLVHLVDHVLHLQHRRDVLADLVEDRRRRARPAPSRRTMLHFDSSATPLPRRSAHPEAAARAWRN